MVYARPKSPELKDFSCERRPTEEPDGNVEELDESPEFGNTVAQS